MQKLKLSLVRGSAPFGVLVAALGAAGCAEETGPSVPVEDVVTQIVALSNGEDTLVFGTFVNEGTSGARRYPVEAVVVSLDGEEKSAFLEPRAATFQYSFFDKTEGSVEVSFMGSELDETFYVHLELPAPFTPQLEQTRVARDEALIVELGESTSAGELAYWLDGDCIESFSASGEDSAQLRIEANSVEARTDQDNVTCEVTLTVARVNKSGLGGGFGRDGEAIAQQERHITFVSLPNRR